MVQQIISNALVPKGALSYAPGDVKGRVVIPQTLDFAAAADYLFDFTTVQQQWKASPPVCMMVDNHLNPSPITVTVSQTNQTYPIPPFSVGIFPLSTQQNSTINFVSDGGLYGTNLTDTVYVEFYNFDLPLFVYAGFAPFVAGSSVAVFGQDQATPMSPTNPFAVTPSTANITSTFVTLVANTDTIIVAAGAAKKFRFRNVGKVDGSQIAAFYLIGGVATATPGVSNILEANGQWETFDNKSGQAVHVISTDTVIIEVQTTN